MSGADQAAAPATATEPLQLWQQHVLGAPAALAAWTPRGRHCDSSHLAGCLIPCILTTHACLRLPAARVLCTIAVCRSSVGAQVRACVRVVGIGDSTVEGVQSVPG
jgi:hypothetical protein